MLQIEVHQLVQDGVGLVEVDLVAVANRVNVVLDARAPPSRWRHLRVGEARHVPEARAEKDVGGGDDVEVRDSAQFAHAERVRIYDGVHVDGVAVHADEAGALGGPKVGQKVRHGLEAGHVAQQLYDGVGGLVDFEHGFVAVEAVGAGVLDVADCG